MGFKEAYATSRAHTKARVRAYFLHRQKLRWGLLACAAVLITSHILLVIQPLFVEKSYALGTAGALLPRTNETITKDISFDSTKKTFSYTPAKDENGKATGIQVSANQSLSEGISVTDPINNVNFSMKSLDGHFDGRQDASRIVYPLKSGVGWTVYTVQKTGVKEDILLRRAESDTATFSYELTLGDSLEARVEKDGSLGVYGNTLLSGDISAATDADAKLLVDARKNAKKDSLLFRIPAPIVVEQGNKTSKEAHAAFSLEGKKLAIHVTGLKKASYPLSIDPSIYVVSARQFMAGNNETNINFNVDEQLIEKSPTTGARFDTWQATTPLPVLTTASGVTVAGGYIYSVGGKSYSEQVFNTQGSSDYVVPDGITSLSVRTWGGGGGGAGGGSSGTGGAGGGAGGVYATIPVTPGETLTLYVGGGGAGGNYHSGGNDAGGGGGGGGYTSIYRGSTPLVIAAGGGGGGGGQATRVGGAGGAGGGTAGANGSQGYANNNGGGGGGGSLWSVGTGGTGGNNNGSSGSSLAGGDGADGRSSQGADGSGASGGLMGGGNGGLPNVNTTRAGGGGGGGGYNGGGGGGSTTNSTSASGGGGGGGASYTDSGLPSVTNNAGTGTTPGNDTNLSRNGAGDGGSGGIGKANGQAGSNGLIVITFGTGTTVTGSVSWAQFSTTDGTVSSANPGSGVCAGWCTSSAYDLPSARSNFSLVAYSGYLYAIGGQDASGARQNTVFIAKLGANGEPQLWHPTDTNKANWTYWYQDTGLSSTRSNFSALVYNSRLYVLGGISGTNTITNSVEYADILPTGQLGSWTSSPNVLTSNRYSMSAHTYNDRIYILGGSEWWLGGPPITTVQYAKINANGSIGAWTTTTPLTTGRASSGGNFSASWGGYLYVSGGCAALDYNGYCTSVMSTTQLASINADGSLDVWDTVGSADDTRVGGTLVTWRGYLYAVGGCLSQDTSTGACGSATLDSIRYGKINPDGDASTVAESSANGSGLCTGGTPSQCNLPGNTYIGNMLTSSFIYNGYLYITGGCTNNACSTTSNDVVYTAINTDGSTTVPATCSGTIQGGAWCFLSNVLPTGLAASSPVVFNNRIYLVGGLTGSANSNTILRSDIAANGSLGTWTSQSMTGVGAANVSYEYAYARANPSSASTNPGNLYVFGGCSTSSSAGCTAYSQGVYKCNIQSAGAIAGCSTSGQLQIGVVPGDTATGLGIMSGTVYANYIYLIGGVSPNIVDMDTVRYAQFDNNNNVVTAGSSNAWVESASKMHVGRRRAAAFGYNGYIYVTGGYDASSVGVIADIEFIKMNVSDGSLGSATEGFVVSSVTINQRWGLTVPVSNSYAYVIGGCTDGASPSGCTARTDVIQTFQIYNNDSGAPSGYSTSANTYGTNPNRIGANSTILNGKLYIAGGCTSTTDCTAVTNNVSYASLDEYGNVGSWTSTGSLPAGRAWGRLENAGGTLYYMGGQSATATDRRAEVYYATPSGTGTIASWATASNTLPGGRTSFGSASWNNRLYVVGGEGTNTGCTSNVCNTVYVSPQLNNGGNITSAWSTASTSFNIPREGLMVATYANNLYVMGGMSGSTYFSDVQYSKLDTATGESGAWTYTESLPNVLAQGDAFAANGYLYIMGGRSAATTCEPVTYVAPISANTSINSGNNPTGVGAWYQANKKYAGARYGATVAYNDGKAYIMGGGCGSTLTYASPVTQQTTLLSQPQIARYSILMDTDSDVFPTSWLLNGVDNSIGAKWQLRYRSMTNTTTSCTSPAMTTWGQETFFGDVTLGLPGVYTPKNGSGANTNCARFYFFYVSVDSSKAYGYPDDYTRGPTITDLTLQFTADPSKRLMHGRTFTGGLQQPVDTPYYSY